MLLNEDFYLLKMKRDKLILTIFQLIGHIKIYIF